MCDVSVSFGGISGLGEHRRAGRRRQCGLGDGSVARREARGRQRGSEGGPETAARLGGRRAWRRQRGSEGGTEARRQRGSEGGPEVAARFGGRRCGSESGSAVRSRRQCSHSKSHSSFLK